MIFYQTCSWLWVILLRVLVECPIIWYEDIQESLKNFFEYIRALEESLTFIFECFDSFVSWRIEICTDCLNQPSMICWIGSLTFRGIQIQISKIFSDTLHRREVFFFKILINEVYEFSEQIFKKNVNKFTDIMCYFLF